MKAYMIYVITCCCFILILTFCSNGDEERKINLIMSPSDVDTLYSKGNLLLLAHIFSDGIASLEWSNMEGGMNVGRDTLMYDSLGFVHNTKLIGNYFKLDHGCGSSCYYSYIMPIKFKSSGKLFTYPIIFDNERGIIVYQGGVDNLVILEDIKSGKTMEIIQPFNTQLRPLSKAIEKAELRDTSLLLNWIMPNGDGTSQEFSITEILR
jgi:hypothetical protein